MSKTLRGRRWTGWSKRQPSLLRPFPVLRVEELEARTVPATFTWTGGGANTNWNNGANWVGGIAPTGAPAANDLLVFPANVANHSPTNNIPGGTFFSITISDSGYTLGGSSISLGSSSKAGNITVGASVLNSKIGFDIALGGAAAFYQVDVGNNSDFTISGKISGGANNDLLKAGVGVLNLSGTNTFSGLVKVNAGSMSISNSKALGATTGDTTVAIGAELLLNSVSGTITEPLIVNGTGVIGASGNKGALRSVGGANTWAGTVKLNADSTFGADVNTSINITGVISSIVPANKVTKDGLGTIQFSAANTYEGITEINEGVLAIANAKALGSGDRTVATGTIVNETLVKAGQLRILGGAAGFTVLNERLQIHGDAGGAENRLGAIYNFTGNNQWAGPVLLGGGSTSSFFTSIGAADGTDLLISGIVQGDLVLEKVEPGRVIFNNANTYTNVTFVTEGILNIRDSRALGFQAVTVRDFGATLELEVEKATTTPQFGYNQAAGVITGPLARDLGIDSVTSDPNRLLIDNPIEIDGLGVGSIGALHSLSGINRVVSDVQITVPPLPAIGQAAIGVELDQRQGGGHPTPSSKYWTDDYSLTIEGQIHGSRPGTTVFGPTLVKRGGGQLILPRDNDYTGETHIEQGWITIQDDHALGAYIVGLGETVQPGTTVSGGAALHLRKLTPASPDLVVNERLTISGKGITHPYSFISGKGALLNLGGDNTWAGDVILQGTGGVGAEQVDASLFSELTVTGSMAGGVLTFNVPATGDNNEYPIPIDTGATSGIIVVNYDFYGIPNRLTAYYPPRGQPGSTLIFDSGFVAGPGTFTIPFGPGTSTMVELVMNEGGTPSGTVWDLTVVLQAGSSGLEKLGSKRVRLLGDASFGGNVAVTEGTLSVENDTALGRSSTGTNTTPQSFSSTSTTVASGAVLEFNPGRATNNGGIAAGTEVFDESLTLNASAYQVAVAGDPLTAMFTLSYPTPTGSFTTIPLSINATAAEVQAALVSPFLTAEGLDPVVTKTGNVFTIVFGTALSDEIPLTAATSGGAEVSILDGQSSVINVASDNTWRGPVTLNSAGTRFRSNDDSRLSLLGTVSDAASSHLVKRGNGTLILGGANTYRGITLISEGIVTLMNDRALGFGGSAAASGTIVRPNAQMQLQGNLTVANEHLTVGGTGPDAAAVPDAIPIRWLQVGAAPANQGQTPGNTSVTGRVTGTAVDPTDAKVIYISTAGGGAWKTKDGGKTWLPLFDLGSPTAPLHGGSIFVSLDDPRIIYYGTGEANNTADSFAGTGVYRSDDSGATWTRLLDTRPGSTPNPLAGQSVSKVIAQVGDRFIYASTSDSQAGSYFQAAPGIWRYDRLTGTWFNMTAVTSTNRATVNGTAAPWANSPPNTPGPDDDYRIRFPQSNVSWTDMAIVYNLNRTQAYLYVALMESPGVNNGGHNSGVYRNENPTSGNPVWYVGNRATDGRANNIFPTGPWDQNTGLATGFPRNGRISLAAANNNGNLAATTVWATIARNRFAGAAYGQLLEIQRSTNAGVTWAAVTTPAAMANVFGVSFMGHGQNNNTMVAADPSTVYLGGINSSHVWRGTVAGTVWTDISLDAANGSGPYAGDHAMAIALNPNNTANSPLILGGDGGVYRFDPTGSTWEDINGTLAAGLYQDIAVDPVDFNAAAGGTQANGTVIFDGSSAWTMTDDKFGGDIYYDPVTPSILYHVQHEMATPLVPGLSTKIRKSTDGGQTWFTAYDTFPFANQNVPMVLDANNHNRILLYNGVDLVESLDGLGSTPVPILPTGYYLANGVRHIALGGQQGPWIDDPDFGPVVDFDRGSNYYDPSTIYISDGVDFSVTKDNGLNWVSRPLNFTREFYTLNFSGGVLKYKSAPLTISFSNVPAGVTVAARTVRDGLGSLVPFSPQIDEQQTLDVFYPNGTTGSFDLTVKIAATGAPFNTPAKNFTITVNLGDSPATIQAAINAALQAGTPLRGDEYQGLVFSNAGGTFRLTVGGVQTAPITNSGVNATTVSAINAAFAAAVPPITGVTAELHGVGANAAIYLHFGVPANTDVPMALATGVGVTVTVHEAQRGGNGTVAVSRTIGTTPEITSITVDPANHDNVFVTAQYLNHARGPTVFRSTDAGRTWMNASGTGLPQLDINGTAVTTSQPAWSFAIDPRDNTLYVGTDVGVYSSTDLGATWSQFGNGMPNVPVRDLELNLGLNTLTAGTYGRSMYQIFLDRARVDSGAIRTVAGNSTWTGPVLLTADTRIETDGTQDIQNGIAASSLHIIGSITDNTSPAVATTIPGGGTGNEVQTVTSFGDAGFYTLSFTNGASTDTTAPLAANATEAQVQAALNALSTIGGVGGFVTVTAAPFGAKGTRYTIEFDGALANTDVQQLTADGDFRILKEGEGTLIFSGKNTYGGVTEVRNGVLQIRNPEALGDSDAASNTIVFDGAALELATDLYREPVLLNGSGYEYSEHFGGSLRNVSGFNTYTGELTLNTPTVTIGVDSGTQLVIGDTDGDVGDADNTGVGTVVDSGATNFLVKELTGTLVFANANAYTGTTQVIQGALRASHPNALGSAVNGTYVYDGAQLQISRNNVTRASTVVVSEPLFLSGTGVFGTGALLNVRGDGLPDGGTNEVQSVTVTGIGGTFTLTFNGQTTAPLAFNATAGQVLAALVALSTIGLGNVSVTAVAGPGTTTYTVTFINGLGNRDVVEMTAVGSGGATANVTTPTEGVTLNNDNRWQGTIEMVEIDNFSPNTDAPREVSYGSSDIRDTLSIDTSIQEENPGYVVNKVGAGRVTFVRANQYTGQTNVLQGYLRVMDVGSLGIVGVGEPGTVVSNGATLELDGTFAPLDMQEDLLLFGDGVGTVGALNNVFENNSYSAPITIGSTAAGAGIGAEPGTELTILGLLQDPVQLATPIENATPGRLRKLGFGTVIIPNAKTYSGLTLVSEGILNIRDPNALGLPRDEVQFVQVSASAGKFALTFKGATTAAIPFDATAADVKAALEAIPTIGGVGSPVGGTVDVVLTAGSGINTYQITFGGTLQNSEQPDIVPVYVAPVISTFRDGTASLAEIQDVQVTAAGDPAGAQVDIDFALSFIGAPVATTTQGSGAVSEVQTVTILGNTGTYTLSFTNGASTATTLPLAATATATEIQAALNALSTIGGVGGTVTVTAAPFGATGTRYTITFGGTLANTNVQQLVLDGARTSAIPVNATAGAVRAALMALPTIGANNVNVTRTGVVDDYTYRITFAGALATGNQSQIQTVAISGTLVTQGTNRDGQRGTTVASGATLQIEGAMTFNFPFTGEIITLNGQGFDPGTGPLGALNIGRLPSEPAGSSGSVTFDSPLPLLLGSDASVGVSNAADTLFIESVISDGGAGHDLDIYGPGTVKFEGDGTGFYAGTKHTGYTGTTTVNSGTLLLNVDVSAVPVPGAILGPLVVGNSPTADGNALVRELRDDQIADNAPVSVNADGVFDLNGLNDRFGNLTMTGGDLFTRNNGDLITGTITMTAGAEIFVGNNATLTGGNTSMTNSDIHVGTNSTVTLGDLNMNASDIDFAPPGPGFLNVGNVSMTNGSTITLPGGKLTITTLDLFLDNSTIDLNNNSSIDARNVTLVNNALIDFDDAGRFTPTGSVSVSSGSDITFDLDGRFNITGNLTLNDGLVSLGNATPPNTALPTTATLTATQIDMTGGTSQILIGNNGYIAASSKVSNSAGDILFGTNGTFTAGGNLTLSNDALVNFGTGGKFNNQPFDLISDNSDFVMADGGSAKTKNIVLTADAQIQFANTGTLTSSGNTTMSGSSDISFLNDGTATTGNLNINTGTFSFLFNGTLNTANVTNTAAAISFTDSGEFNAGVVNVVGGSIGFGPAPNAAYPYVAPGGTGGVFTATGAVSLDAGKFWMGDGGTAAMTGLSLVNASKASFNDNVTVNVLPNGPVSLNNASEILFGNTGKLVSGVLTQTGGLISFQNGGKLDPAAANITSGTVKFLDNGAFTPDSLTTTSATITFGKFGALNTLGGGTGIVSLNKSTLTFGDNADVDTKAFSTNGATTITTGDNGTIDTDAVVIGGTGGILDFGDNVAFTANGNFTMGNATGDWDTFGTLKVTGALALTSSFLTFDQNGTVRVIGPTGNADLTGSQITYAGNGTLNADGDVTMKTTSKLTFANDGLLQAKNVGITGGSITMGTSADLLASGTVNVLGATVTLGTGSKFDADGDVSIKINAASTATLKVGSGSTVDTGNLTIETATLDVGANSVITTVGNVNVSVPLIGSAKVTVGSDSTFNVSGNVNSTTGTWKFTGSNDKLLVGGAVSFTNSSVSFETPGAGGKLQAGDDLTLNNTPVTFGVNGNVTVEDLFVHNKAKITFGNGGTLTATGPLNNNKGAIEVTGTSQIRFGSAGGAMTGGDTTVGDVAAPFGSIITGGTNIAINIGALKMNPNTTFTFGDGSGGTMKGNVDMADAGLSFGSGSNVAVTGTLTSNNSTIAFGNNGGLAITGNATANLSTINVGDNFNFSAADTALTDTGYDQGNFGSFTTQDLTLTDSLANLGTNIVGNVQDDLGVFNSTMLLGTSTTLAIAGDIAADSSPFGTVSTIAGGGTINLGTATHGMAVGDADGQDTVDFGIYTEIASSATARLVKAAANEIQDVVVLGGTGANSFTLTFNGQTTAPIAGNAANSTVAAALNALANIGAGGVVVTSAAVSGGVRYTVTFSGPTVQSLNHNLMTAAGLLGLATPTVQRVQDGSTGTGRLELAAPSGAIVDLTISAGDVQVTGAVQSPTAAGDVQLAGGTLSGSGAVQFLNGPSGPAVGNVRPGNNWDIVKSGILSSQGAVWGPNTKFNVDLSSSSPGSPTAGTDYDQVRVFGDIALGDAELSANYGPGILLNDSFTIVSATGDVTGKFKQFNNQDILFVAGQKFAIVYTQHTVVLNKVRANATVSMTSAPNPSTLNQPITLVATVVPEPGALLFPGTMTVTFYDNGNAIASPFVYEPTPNVFTAVHTFTSLTVGSHVLTATFNGDADNFNPANTQPPQVVQVVEQPIADPLTGGPANLSPNNLSSAGVQDTYTFATKVRFERGDIDWRIDIANSSNVVVRTLTGTGSPDAFNEIPIVGVTWNGKSDTLNYVPDGLYTATFSVAPDEFGNTFSATPIQITVDNTSPFSSLNTPSPVAIDPIGPSVLQNSTVITGTVSDTNLSGWVLSISNGTSVIRSYSLFNGTGNVNVTWNGKYDPLDATDPINPTVTAPDGAYTVTLTAIDRAGNNATSSSQTVVVLANGPIVSLTSNTPTVYGQSFTLTATVSLPPGSPAGLSSLLGNDTIQFFRGASLVGTSNLPPTGVNGVFQTSVTLPTLNAGTYPDFTAVYVQSTDFPRGVSAQFSHTIDKAPLVVTAQNKTRVYGAANPPLTYTVSGLVNGDTATGVLGGALFTGATVTTGVGTYPITQGTLAPNGNYIISTFNNGTLTITPAGLTLRIDDKTRPVNTLNPAFTFTVTGLLNGDPPSVVSSLPMGTTATIASPVGSYPITATGAPVVNANYNVVNIIPGTLAVTPVLTNFAIGNGASLSPTNPSVVEIHRPDGSLIRSFTPFGAFPGGIRTAVADFNGDGKQDIAVATGPGVITQVSVFDGVTGGSLFNVFPFEDFNTSFVDFTGGAFVAAGDINADGVAELVITPDQSGGPRVIAYRGGDFAPFISYFGINDPDFRGGARAGVGDMNGDGFAEIAVSAGFQGGPRISIWDGKSITAAQFTNVVPDFYAFDESLRNGAYVAIGDVNGDGFGDLIAGAGPGGGPHVKIFSGKSLLDPLIGPAFTQPFASFMGGDPENRGGIRVAAKVFDNDLYVDLLTGSGDMGGDTTTAYLGKDLKNGVVDDLFSLDFPGLNNNGVFVG